MDLKSIKEQFEKGNVDITLLLEGLVDQFKKDKYSLDVQQLQLLCEYLITQREGE